jgi:hypothetical protein
MLLAVSFKRKEGVVNYQCWRACAQQSMLVRRPLSNFRASKVKWKERLAVEEENMWVGFKMRERGVDL